MSAISSPPSKSISKGFWSLFLGALIVPFISFTGSVCQLNSSTTEISSKFSALAVDHFMGYVVRMNLKAFGAYLLVAVLTAFLSYPVVRWLVHRKTATPSKRAWFYYGLAASLVLWGFAVLRFWYASPSFFALHVTEITGVSETTRQWIGYAKIVGFTLLPWTVFGLVSLHYLTNILQKGARRWSRPTCRRVVLLATFGVVSLMIVSNRNASSQKTAAARKDTRPNLLILATDSLRADHLSCNGYVRQTSPNIDALAKKSVNFQRCLTPIASTVESITSIMTAQYPHTHGLQHMFPNRQQVEHMQANSPALADILKKNGYETSVFGDWCAGVFDLLHLGYSEDERSVSTFDNFKVYLTEAIYKAHAVLPLFYDNKVGYTLYPELKNCASFVTPEVATARLKTKLSEAAQSEKPFFITAFYSITHLPYAISPPYSTKFTDPKYKGPHQGRMDVNLGEFIGGVDIAKAWQQMPKQDVDQIKGLYDGCIAKFDDTVKSVLDHLKENGLAENTVVLITSDHGDDLFEPNTTFGHGLTFNGGDQNTHIPAIFYVPGRGDAEKKVSQVTRSLDFAPTFLALAGVEKDPRMAGQSLLPYIKGTTDNLGLAYYGETSYLFCKRFIPGEEPLYIPAMDETTEVDESFECHMVLKPKFQDLVLSTKERCLRTQDWKVIFTPGMHHDIWRLFHLPSDPHCEVPLQLDYPAVFKPMQAALVKWMVDKQELRIPDIFPQGEPKKSPLTSHN